MTHRVWLLNQVKAKGWTRGAELGVKAGETLDVLLGNLPNLYMIGVDDWKQRPGYDKDEWHHDLYRNRAYSVARRYGSRCCLIEDTTLCAALQVEDASLDFVFIDADHSTEAVKKDISAWWRKIKPGGMLCGDDAQRHTVVAALNQCVPGWRRKGRVWYGRS